MDSITPRIEEPEVTNNELAHMIAAGFHGVDERFKDIESRMATKDDLAELKKELLGHILVVDERVTSIQQSMLTVSDHLYLERRVDALEDTVQKLVKKPQLGY